MSAWCASLLLSEQQFVQWARTNYKLDTIMTTNQGCSSAIILNYVFKFASSASNKIYD
jgi:hypothetical protein